MNFKQIEIASCCFDIIIIFSPFLLLLGSGIEIFIWSFYIIYLPYLLFSVYKNNLKKKNRLMLEHEFKKIAEKDLLIHE
jgi:hypothetical protein